MRLVFVLAAAGLLLMGAAVSAHEFGGLYSKELTSLINKAEVFRWIRGDG